MSDTTAFPPVYVHIYQGKKYELLFDPWQPLHIPDNYLPPQDGENICWGIEGIPATYESHRLNNELVTAGVYRNPLSGEKSLSISVTDDLTEDEATTALGILISWHKVATGA